MIGFWTPGPTEIVIILGLALLLFGKRLPEVGRSLGRGIVEFKKGVKGIEDEIETTVAEAARLPSPDLPSSDPHEDDPYRAVEKGRAVENGAPPTESDEVLADAPPPASKSEPANGESEAEPGEKA